MPAHPRSPAPRDRPRERPRPRVVVLGDLLVDVATRLDEPVAAGSDAAAKIRFLVGGSGANVALAVARLGRPAIFVGAVGADAWGEALGAALVDAGVTCHLVHRRTPTGRIVAIVETDGERSFLTDRAAALELVPAAMRAAWVRGAAVLHLPLYSLLGGRIATAAQRLADLAGRAGAVISVDLSSAAPIRAAGPASVRAGLARLAPAVIFATPDEVAALLGGADPGDLLAIAPIVVIKLGAGGCRVLVRRPGGADLDLVVPARRRRVIDSTGAGDAFAAGFLVSWAVDGRPSTSPPGLRAAAQAGHRAAAASLARPRPELTLGGLIWYRGPAGDARPGVDP